MSEPLVGVVIVTHGLLATELLNAAETIVGDLSRFTAVSIGWHDDVPVATSAMARAITRVDTGAGVLLLTDMFGGTPANLAMTFLEAGRIEVVTGVNLPMLLKFFSYRGTHGLTDLVQLLREHARGSILIAGELLQSQP